MVEEAEAALAPLAITAALFAVDGPVDLLLNVVPVGKLGRAYHRGKEALRARKARKLTDQMVSDFARDLEEEHKHILRLVQHLSRAELKALKTIHRHTGSQAVFTALLDRHVRHSADVRWIAAKLERRKAPGRKVLYGEVKNWSSDTWKVAANRQRILDQLRRHNGGIADHLVETGRSTSNVVNRVLFVAERGFRTGLAGA